MRGSKAAHWRWPGAPGSQPTSGTYAPTPATRASLGGTTQPLSGRHTLVGFGDGGAVQEYDGDGAVVWEIEGDAGYIFRTQRIGSLYHPEIGMAR